MVAYIAPRTFVFGVFVSWPEVAFQVQEICPDSGRGFFVLIFEDGLF
jgi:hypothetical protein